MSDRKPRPKLGESSSRKPSKPRIKRVVNVKIKSSASPAMPSADELPGDSDAGGDRPRRRHANGSRTEDRRPPRRRPNGARSDGARSGGARSEEQRSPRSRSPRSEGDRPVQQRSTGSRSQDYRPIRHRSSSPRSQESRSLGDRFSSQRSEEVRGVRRRPDTQQEEDRTVNDTESDSSDLIYGRHPVLTALETQQSFNRLWVTTRLRYDPRFHALINQAKTEGAVIHEVEPQRLDQLTSGANHQGIAAQVSPYEYLELDDLILQAKAASTQPVVLVADSITDPQNLGAIIRTAEAMGAQGIVIPQRRAVGITSTVMKVAAGALSSFPVARVVNLAQALETLKQQEFWIYGAAVGQGQALHTTNFTGAIAIVVGSEGDGLSLRAQKSCDVLVSIPLAGQTASLNASVATGMVLYELYRQRWASRLYLEQ